MRKAQLIELNIDLVERASTVIRSAVANAMDWGDIELLVRDAQARGDPVAMAIHSLKLGSNEVTLLLRYVSIQQLRVEFQTFACFSRTKTINSATILKVFRVSSSFSRKVFPNFDQL